jgi:hypothetical protein
MIKYINTETTDRDELFSEIKTLRGGLTDDQIIKEIIEPIYNNFSECLYKFTTDSYVAYRPKGTEYWVENPKNNILFIESHTTPKAILLNEISKTKGIGTATQTVNKWYEDYSAFLFDTTTGEILYMLDRYRGAWTVNMQNIMKYKK